MSIQETERYILIFVLAIIYSTLCGEIAREKIDDKQMIEIEI